MTSRGHHGKIVKMLIYRGQNAPPLVLPSSSGSRRSGLEGVGSSRGASLRSRCYHASSASIAAACRRAVLCSLPLLWSLLHMCRDANAIGVGITHGFLQDGRGRVLGDDETEMAEVGHDPHIAHSEEVGADGESSAFNSAGGSDGKGNNHAAVVEVSAAPEGAPQQSFTTVGRVKNVTNRASPSTTTTSTFLEEQASRKAAARQKKSGKAVIKAALKSSNGRYIRGTSKSLTENRKKEQRKRKEKVATTASSSIPPRTKFVDLPLALLREYLSDAFEMVQHGIVDLIEKQHVASEENFIWDHAKVAKELHSSPLEERMFEDFVFWIRAHPDRMFAVDAMLDHLHLSNFTISSSWGDENYRYGGIDEQTAGLCRAFFNKGRGLPMIRDIWRKRNDWTGQAAATFRKMNSDYAIGIEQGDDSDSSDDEGQASFGAQATSRGDEDDAPVESEGAETDSDSDASSSSDEKSFGPGGYHAFARRSAMERLQVRHFCVMPNLDLRSFFSSLAQVYVQHFEKVFRWLAPAYHSKKQITHLLNPELIPLQAPDPLYLQVFRWGLPLAAELHAAKIPVEHAERVTQMLIYHLDDLAYAQDKQLLFGRIQSRLMSAQWLGRLTDKEIVEQLVMKYFDVVAGPLLENLDRIAGEEVEERGAGGAAGGAVLGRQRQKHQQFYDQGQDFLQELLRKNHVAAQGAATSKEDEDEDEDETARGSPPQYQHRRMLHASKRIEIFEDNPRFYLYGNIVTHDREVGEGGKPLAFDPDRVVVVATGGAGFWQDKSGMHEKLRLAALNHD